MTGMELKAAYEFGRDAIKTYVERGEQLPGWLVERTLEMADALIEKLDDEEEED